MVDAKLDVVVVGAGPAGIQAAIRAASLGAETALVTKDYVGGMATNDGTVPVRTLAYAARLVREARQLERYGIASVPPLVDYGSLLGRVQEVVREVHEQVDFRRELESLGVTIHEQAGVARFADPHTVETETGLRLEGQKIIICAGGRPRRLPVPGVEHTATHSDAWGLRDVPESMVVVGTGATGVQVASIFDAFGTKISLFEVAPRILPTEDPDVSAAMREALEALGIEVVAGFDGIEAVEPAGNGVRFKYTMAGETHALEVSVVVLAVGWVADADGLSLAAAGVELDRRGYIEVNEYLQTNVSHIFAAGDINGESMLVPSSVQEGYYAASNAVEGLKHPLKRDLIPVGSFTDPEYAQIGLTEAQAREEHEVVVSSVPFDRFPRAIIDGRASGFCKMIVDRGSLKILGCHVVGERAVETVQLVAAGMKVGLTVSQLADIPLSFPTYVAVVGWAANDVVSQLGLARGWEPNRVQV